MTKKKKAAKPRNKAKAKLPTPKRSRTGTSSTGKLPRQFKVGDRSDSNQLVLAFPGVVTPQGLLLDRNAPYKSWAPVGIQLRKLGDWAQFAIGDWLNHGETVYGETYAQAADETGYAPESLQKLKSIANAVPISIRRLDKLFYGHHVLVAPTKYKPEEKVMWLERAIENKWGVRKMHEMMMGPKAASEVEEETDIGGGCETCGASPAPMKVCGACGAVASAASETIGARAAIDSLKRKASKPQLEMLRWAFEWVKEPRIFGSDEEEASWHARYDGLKKLAEKMDKKAA